MGITERLKKIFESMNSSNASQNSTVSQTTAGPASTAPAAQVPKTTPISVPGTSAPRTTPAAASTPKIDPKKGVNGAKVFADITAKKPTLGENSINDLIDAYNAGYNDTDISTEIKANADAGDYTSELEAVIKAGKADTSAKLAQDKASKDLSTDAARNEKSAQAKTNYIPFKTPQDKLNTENFKDYPDILNFAEYFKGDSKKNNNTNSTGSKPSSKTSSMGSTSSTATNPGKTTSYGNVDPLVGPAGSSIIKDLFADTKFSYLDKSESAYSDDDRKIYNDLTVAYSAGLNGKTIPDNLKATNGGYLTYFNNVYKAGVEDAITFKKTKESLKTISNTGSLVMPVEGVLKWRNDYPNYPSGDPHEGRDLSGEKAIAMGNMVVIGTYSQNTNRKKYDKKLKKEYYQNYLDNGWGNCVIFGMEYNGGFYYIVYGHLDTLPDLQPGQILSKGDVVGQIGSTGHSSGPHLHVSVMQEVLVNGKKCAIYVDPKILFGNEFSPDTSTVDKTLVSGTMYTYDEGLYDWD